MSADKPKLSPESLNRLTRHAEPLMAQLEGPGPFQLPLLTRVESTLGPDQEGRLEIRLETESGQEIRIVLTEEAVSTLSGLLRVYFLKQSKAAKDRKN